MLCLKFTQGMIVSKTSSSLMKTDKIKQISPMPSKRLADLDNNKFPKLKLRETINKISIIKSKNINTALHVNRKSSAGIKNNHHSKMLILPNNKRKVYFH